MHTHTRLTRESENNSQIVVKQYLGQFKAKLNQYENYPDFDN